MSQKVVETRKNFITQEAHARHGAVRLDVLLANRGVVTTRRDILLLLSECKFLTFTMTAMRFTSYSDGSLGPKVVQTIGTSNKMRTFFVVICVFLRITGFGRGLFADGGGRKRA